MRFIALAGLLTLPIGALAQTPTIGSVALSDCSAFDNGASAVGEVYALKATGTDPNNDWQAHLVSKGGGGVGMTAPDFNAATYSALGGNFTRPEAAANVVAVFVTMPGGALHFDSGDLSTGFNAMDNAATTIVGNSFTGGLTLPGTDAAYQVDFGAGAVDFPAVGETGGVPGAINYAFAPFPELADDGVPGNCDFGGALGDPGAANSAGTFIAGYNVYRMAGAAGAAPDQATLGTVANWAGYVPMTFDFATADTMPGAPGSGAPTDADELGDLAGLQNLDGVAWSGDEVLLLQDGATTPGGTANPNAPDPTMAYWYAVQPVIRGSVADFAAVSLARGPVQDHTMSLGGGGANAVDLDLDGTPEFFSPNEDAGIPGLGLTHNSLPLLSPAAWSDPTRLPATGYLGLDVEMGRHGAELSLNAALEGGNVLGYNVYRLGGESRELVNESLIAARGGNGNSYSLVDDRFTGRRARALSYEVDVVYNDGTDAKTFGPFGTEAATRGSARRSR